MSDPLPSVDEFLRLAHLFAQGSWPGSHPVEVRIVMIDGSVKPLAMLGVHANRMTVQGAVQSAAEPSQTPPAPEKKPSEPVEENWCPNDNQQAILDALEFKALRTDDLINESGVCRARLFQKPKGGIHELRRRGEVRLHPKYGYYRPEAPPVELINTDLDERPERQK